MTTFTSVTSSYDRCLDYLWISYHILQRIAVYRCCYGCASQTVKPTIRICCSSDRSPLIPTFFFQFGGACMILRSFIPALLHLNASLVSDFHIACGQPMVLVAFLCSMSASFDMISLAFQQDSDILRAFGHLYAYNGTQLNGLRSSLSSPAALESHSGIIAPNLPLPSSFLS